MSMTKGEALKIVVAVEETADYMDSDDHSHGVVTSALRDLAGRLERALGVPECSCRWGHDEDYGDKSCPRRGFGEES